MWFGVSYSYSCSAVPATAEGRLVVFWWSVHTCIQTYRCLPAGAWFSHSYLNGNSLANVAWLLCRFEVLLLILYVLMFNICIPWVQSLKTEFNMHSVSWITNSSKNIWLVGWAVGVMLSFACSSSVTAPLLLTEVWKQTTITSMRLANTFILPVTEKRVHL